MVDRLCQPRFLRAQRGHRIREAFSRRTTRRPFEHVGEPCSGGSLPKIGQGAAFDLAPLATAFTEQIGGREFRWGTLTTHTPTLQRVSMETQEDKQVKDTTIKLAWSPTGLFEKRPPFD